MQSHGSTPDAIVSSREYELELLRTHNIIKEAIALLHGISFDEPENVQAEIKGIIRLLEHSQDKTHILEAAFVCDSAMERSFSKKLLADFPDLTVSERKLCLLTVQHLSTKQITDITWQSVDAVNKLRSRLRKKFALNGSKTTLLEFLDNYRK